MGLSQSTLHCTKCHQQKVLHLLGLQSVQGLEVLVSADGTSLTRTLSSERRRIRSSSRGSLLHEAGPSRPFGGT